MQDMKKPKDLMELGPGMGDQIRKKAEKNIQKLGEQLQTGGVEAKTESGIEVNVLADKATMKEMRADLVHDYAEHKPGNTLRGKLTGDVGENLYAEGLDKSSNLNDHALNLNEFRNNFPLCDVTSPDEMVSVKTYAWNENESAKNAAYAKELKRITGESKPAEKGRYEGMTASDVCADRLSQVRGEEPDKWESLSQHLPPEVSKAVECGDRDQIAGAIERNSAMAIPDDHVGSLKSYVERHPDKVGIDLSATAGERQVQMQDVLGRIRPLGVRSDNVRAEVSRIYDRLPQS